MGRQELRATAYPSRRRVVPREPGGARLLNDGVGGRCKSVAHSFVRASTRAR